MSADAFTEFMLGDLPVTPTRWERYAFCVDCQAQAGEVCVYLAAMERRGARVPMPTPHINRPRRVGAPGVP